MNRGSTPRARPDLLLAGGVIVAFTASYLGFHLSTHLPSDLASGSAGLLRGQTHWITFQNRVLGPALVELVRLATGWPWLRAFYAVVAACQLAAGAVLVHRAWRRDGRPLAGLGAVSAWFLLAVMFNHGWSYPWDFVGALLHLLLFAWVAERYRTPADLLAWPPLLLLAALALNRESSLVALASLAVLVVARSAATGRLRALPAPLAALAAAAVANVALVVGLRRALFAGSTRPAGLGPVNETAVGNFLQWRENLGLLLAERLPVRLQLLAIAAGLALLLVAGALRCRRDWREPGGPSPALVFPLAYLAVGSAAVAVFACASEFRVFYELIPACVLLGEALHAPARAAPPA